MPFHDTIKNFDFSSFVDITFVSIVIYTMFFWLKKSRATFVVAGVLIASAIYLLARELRLHLATLLMQGFFAVILVAIVIIFQEELRRFFEQLAMWSLNPRLRRRKVGRLMRREAEIVANTVWDLAEDRVGALMVVQGSDPIGRHLYGGVDLNGILSEPLLKSIFDPHSIGHDGAVVIDGGRVNQFSCHLPLSRNLEKLKKSGTRHAAALGLAELSDALSIVVSEERGTVSIARDGQIKEYKDKQEFQQTLESFFNRVNPVTRGKTLRMFLGENLLEKTAAVFLAVVLWFVFVHESVILYRSYTVPVRHLGEPAGVSVRQVIPSEVKVILSGPRRDFYFVDPEDVHLTLKLFDLTEAKRFGENKYQVTVQPSDLETPFELTVANIVPRTVMVQVDKPLVHSPEAPHD